MFYNKRKKIPYAVPDSLYNTYHCSSFSKATPVVITRTAMGGPLCRNCWPLDPPLSCHLQDGLDATKVRPLVAAAACSNCVHTQCGLFFSSSSG